MNLYQPCWVSVRYLGIFHIENIHRKLFCTPQKTLPRQNYTSKFTEILLNHTQAWSDKKPDPGWASTGRNTSNMDQNLTQAGHQEFIRDWLKAIQEDCRLPARKQTADLSRGNSKSSPCLIAVGKIADLREWAKVQNQQWWPSKHTCNTVPCLNQNQFHHSSAITALLPQNNQCVWLLGGNH